MTFLAETWMLTRWMLELFACFAVPLLIVAWVDSRRD